MTATLLLLACLSAAGGDGGPRAIAGDKEVVVAGRVGGRTMIVALRGRDWPTSDIGADEAAYGETVRMVQSMKIVVGESTLFVPRSAFGDLLDADSVRIEPVRGGATIVIRGGDACAGYEARIEVDGTRVKRRRVVALEVGEVVEETTYTQRVMRDVP